MYIKKDAHSFFSSLSNSKTLATRMQRVKDRKERDVILHPAVLSSTKKGTVSWCRDDYGWYRKHKTPRRRYHLYINFYYYHHRTERGTSALFHSTSLSFKLKIKNKKTFRITANTTDRRAKKKKNCVLRRTGIAFLNIIFSFLFLPGRL